MHRCRWWPQARSLVWTPATTPQEASLLIEKMAMERRLRPIMIEEPTSGRGTDNFNRHARSVRSSIIMPRITDEALQAAVNPLRNTQPAPFHKAFA